MTKPTRDVYDSPRVAGAYASQRPPVHEPILRAIAGDIVGPAPVRWALDIGCGAGASTVALTRLARRTAGVDSSETMLASGRTAAPRAAFVAGNAEQLPFAAGTFQLVTAAGSINYTDSNRFLPEAARVLAPGGTLAIYDFSPGRRLRSGGQLADWYEAFAQRYPRPSGYALDVRNLDYPRAGLRLAGYHALEIPIWMSLSSYLSYMMSESRVALAIAGGVDEGGIRDWCRRTLDFVFGDRSCEVIFDAYAACVRHAPRSILPSSC